MTSSLVTGAISSTLRMLSMFSALSESVWMPRDLTEILRSSTSRSPNTKLPETKANVSCSLSSVISRAISLACS